MQEKDQILLKLKKFGQEHLLAFYDELSVLEKNNLLDQIKKIDFDFISNIIPETVLKKETPAKFENIEQVSFLSAKPENDKQKLYYQKAKDTGAKLLHDGRVAALTVAGGQGSRLGFNGPKGSLAVTPVKKKSLFQYFAEFLIRAAEKFGHDIFWYIMTSEVNDYETRAFFSKHNFFGMKPGLVKFFVQGTMPAFSFNGKILLKDKANIAFSPDGHGGTLRALKSSGLLEHMKQNSIEHISYFQVDNPLVYLIDPLFIGLHSLNDADISSKVIKKIDPFEKLGLFCNYKNRIQVIEYSDLPHELATLKNSNGDLIFNAGSPAIHIFKRTFIESLISKGEISLPWHRAEKIVPFIDLNGDKIIPNNPNAVKLETFIFDLFPFTEKILLFEAIKADEFAPIKNKTGDDSLEMAEIMLIKRDLRRLKAAGFKVPEYSDSTTLPSIEISPLTFFDTEDIITKYSNNPKPCITYEEEFYLQ
jgi:UDP-N-acetylglucosamine/UDP-N-acetylgalactosamine diphosphorylase